MCGTSRLRKFSCGARLPVCICIYVCEMLPGELEERERERVYFTHMHTPRGIHMYIWSSEREGKRDATWVRESHAEYYADYEIILRASSIIVVMLSSSSSGFFIDLNDWKIGLVWKVKFHCNFFAIFSIYTRLFESFGVFAPKYVTLQNHD